MNVKCVTYKSKQARNWIITYGGDHRLLDANEQLKSWSNKFIIKHDKRHDQKAVSSYLKFILEFTETAFFAVSINI